MQEREKIRRRVSKVSYIAVILLIILIFLLGMLFGDWIAGLNSKEFSANQQKLMMDLIGLELKDKLISQKDICNLTWQDVWQEKVELGTRINSLELRYGKDNSEILAQKEIYTLIEIRTLLLLEEINQKCNQNFTIIIFFYTNRKNDPLGRWQACEDQGYILTQLGKEMDNIYVLSFDVNINNPALNMLKNRYKINKVPALVIKDKVSDYKTLEELKETI